MLRAQELGISKQLPLYIPPVPVPKENQQNFQDLKIINNEIPTVVRQLEAKYPPGFIPTRVSNIIFPIGTIESIPNTTFD